MSKVALTALTKVQQKSFDSDKTKEGIIVSAVCPGYCKTDMAQGGGFLTAKQGEFLNYYYQCTVNNDNFLFNRPFDI